MDKQKALFEKTKQNIVKASIVPNHVVLSGGMHCVGWHDTTLLDNTRLMIIACEITSGLNRSDYQIMPLITEYDQDTRLAKEIAKLYSTPPINDLNYFDQNSQELVLVISCNTTWTTVDATLRPYPNLTYQDIHVLSIFDRTGGVRPKHLEPIDYRFFAKSPLQTYAEIDCPYPDCQAKPFQPRLVLTSSLVR